MELSQKWNKTYMEIALLISSHSFAKRAKVGAILVKDKKIISFGYNGMPSFMENECEQSDITKKEVLHAELNCLSKCAKTGESSDGAILYITHSPCLGCAKLLIQCGIKKVYFRYKYHDIEGLNLLKRLKIEFYEI